MTSSCLKFKLMVAALGLAPSGLAQSGFAGTVMSGGAPVANARMTLFTSNLSRFFETRTAANGTYSFSNVPSGPYALGAAALRYNYQQIVVDTNGGTQTKNFALAQESHQGQWSVVGNTLPEFLDGTDIAVLLADGRIFYCHDTVEPVIFDPVTGIKSFPSGSGLPSGCMNGTLLQNGRVLFVGGQQGDDPGNFRLAVRYVRTYDPLSNTWQRLPDLQLPEGRWYPGLARLADGSSLIMGGGTRPNASRTDTCELFSQQNGLCTFTGSMRNQCEFPPSVLLQSGDVLATWSPPQIYSPYSGSWRPTGNFMQPNRGWPDHSDHSLVMLSDGRALALGVRAGPNGNSVMGEIFNPATESWSLTSNPGLLRFQTEVVQMPDGRVLSAGGEATNPNPPVANVLGIVKWSELYDPTNNSWRRIAEMAQFREYHAVTLLVPDGRVLTTGGTRIKFQVGPTSSDIESFAPPYLFRGIRPQITSSFAIGYKPGMGLSFSIFPATRLTSVVLIPTGATTHWVDGSISRRIVLSVSQVGTDVRVVLPKTYNAIPAGHYMLFAMVDDIPSTAKIIKVMGLQRAGP